VQVLQVTGGSTIRDASFYILTSDGVAIVEARDGYLWTQAASVGWTRLPDAGLEAVLARVPATRFDDLAPLVKRYAKAVKPPPVA
jgi:hypothetical protein